MTHKWMDIFARAHDEDLGAALTRLARQAVAVHQFEVAARADQQQLAADQPELGDALLSVHTEARR